MMTIEGKLSSLSCGNWIKEKLLGNEKVHCLGVSDPGAFSRSLTAWYQHAIKKLSATIALPVFI